MKLLFTLFSLLCLSAYAQTLDWVRGAGTTGNDVGFSVLTDNEGYVYTIGIFWDSLDFSPVHDTTLISNGDGDFFIQKLDADGNFVWVKQIGGPGHDWASETVMDEEGNLYITGEYSFTVDFDPGDGVDMLTTPTEYHPNIFTAKYNSDGELIWAKGFGGNGSEAGLSVCIDVLNNVYTTGVYRDTIDADPGDGVFNLLPVAGSGFTDTFIQKLDPDGNFVWAKALLGEQSKSPAFIFSEGTNFLFLTGHFHGTVDFNPDEDVENHSSNGNRDAFILKLDVAGNFSWVKTFGGDGADIAYSLGIDQMDNIYCSGYFQQTVDFDPGPGEDFLTSSGTGEYADGFILKLDQSGDYIWSKRIGGDYHDIIKDMIVSSDDKIYLSGRFLEVADLDPGPAELLMDAGEGTNSFIEKLDADGNLLWVKNFGGDGIAKTYGMHLDDENNVYQTGVFRGLTDFDPNDGVVNLNELEDEGDVYTLKLNPEVAGLGNSVSLDQVLVYPNPSNGIVNVVLPETEAEVLVTLTNQTGSVVFEESVKEQNRMRFDLGKFPSGYYVLSIRTSDGSFIYHPIILI